MQKQRLKTLTGSILAVLMALSGVTAPAHADPPAPGVEEKLPESPPPPPSVPNYGTTFLPDGTPVAVMVSGGSGGLVNLINLNTAKPVDEPQILAAEGVDAQPWGFARMNDNSVLIGASDNLYRYDPSKPRAERITTLSEVGKDGFTTELKSKLKFVWDIALDDSGTAYIASHSKEENGTVLTYKQGVGWGLLEGAAPLDPKEAHARSIDYDDGKLYVTVSTANPRLFVFDLSKPGSKEVIPLPPEVVAKKGEHLAFLEVQAGIAYIGHNDGSGTTALNLATGEHEFWDKVTSNVIPRPDEPKKVTYWKKLEGQSARLVEYDPDTKQHTDLLVDNSLLRRIAATSWATHDLFVSSEMNGGRISIYRAGEAKSTMHSGLVIPMRREIGALTVAENGNIYGGWYMVARKLLQVTPAAKAEDTSYTLPDAPLGQVEGIATHGDHLVTGLYLKAQIGFHSLSDPSKFPPPLTMATKKSLQDRPYAVIHTTGDQFALGSVPSNGQLGGALALVDAKAKTIETDPATKQPAIYRFKEIKNAEGQVVAELADQSPVSMAYRDGKLYIGTTIRGGHSDRAKNPDGSLQEAYLVEFDLAKRVVTRIMNPFPGKGQRAVAALTWGENGMLHGATGQFAFTVDPASFTVTNSRVMKGDGELVNRTWLLHRDGELFGVFGGSLYAFSSDLKGEPALIAAPIELTIPTRGDEAVRLPVGSPVIGKDNFLYYARGPELYRHSYLQAKSGPAPQGQTSATAAPSPQPSASAPAKPSTPVAPVPRPGLPKTGMPR
ncbi:MAG: hypothetical protein Q4D96_13800 [Propionibacteriaceae bacterium]|nr:hypothetical protein [Propionibacteriaceae bacterium]